MLIWFISISVRHFVLNCVTYKMPLYQTATKWSFAVFCALFLLFSDLNQHTSTLANHHEKRPSADDYAKAFDHGARVRLEGSCHTPHPTIVYVNTTDPSKVYMPRATVLHRCSDLTGCCQHPSETCEAIEMQTVELYFITIQLQVQNSHKNRRVRQSPKVEKIMFTNHTQCGCRERNTNDIGYVLYNDLKWSEWSNQNQHNFLLIFRFPYILWILKCAKNSIISNWQQKLVLKWSSRVYLNYIPLCT